VDDNALGVQRVLELDVDGVAGAGADRRAGELPVDADEHLLLTVRRPEHVAHLPFEVPRLRLRAMRPDDERPNGAALRHQQQRKSHGLLCSSLHTAPTVNAKILVGFRGSNNGGRDAGQCESLVSGIKVRNIKTAGGLVISQELVARM
jgi:hypothetical protein